MLIVDDVDMLKQGHHSVGVKRQYAGSIGKIASCQVGVDLVAAVPGEARNADQITWPLGLELYLPRKWVEDDEFEDRRQQCDIPEDIRFRTKPEIAIGLVSRARKASVPTPAWGPTRGMGNISHSELNSENGMNPIYSVSDQKLCLLFQNQLRLRNLDGGRDVADPVRTTIS